MSNATVANASKWVKLAVAAAAAAWGTSAAGQNVHWLTDGGATLNSGILPSIFLTDTTVDRVDKYLAAQSGPKVLKIPADVSAATIAAIYNKYTIDYTFADIEGPGAVERTAALVSAIKASSGTGAAVQANRAFVGNFGFAPMTMDSTSAGTVHGRSDYAAAGLNMSSEALYPGSAGFRSPTTGDSAAPNVRSALFALPITRLSFASTAMSPGHAHIPYVNRFNNWPNPALDTDGDPSNGYRFVTQDQLPSRGDFQAQILHYRLRGATGVHGLDGGVEGYTPEQFEADIQAGWGGTAAVNGVLADPKARLVTLDSKVKSDGLTKSLEEAGVVLSGAYSLTQGKMVVLLSNLDERGHNVNLPVSVGGKAVAGDFSIGAGKHEILEFGAAGTRWDLLSTTAAFTDDDRGGVGVPEPSAALALAGASVACGLGLRRRRAERPV